MKKLRRSFQQPHGQYNTIEKTPLRPVPLQTLGIIISKDNMVCLSHTPAG